MLSWVFINSKHFIYTIAPKQTLVGIFDGFTMKLACVSSRSHGRLWIVHILLHIIITNIKQFSPVHWPVSSELEYWHIS